MKKFVITLIILCILGIGGYFGYKYFFSDEESSLIPKKEEPKLQILDENSKSRTICVAINNNHDAWPHAGLQDSFLNYEIIAEGGISRILAFFKDKDTEKIGSVRSARHYFLDYVLENDAIFVHYGFSDAAASDIETLGINNVNGLYDDAAFYRDETLDKAYEHTAFTTMELINDAIERNEYRNTSDVTLLKYSVKSNKINEREDAFKADEVLIEYSYWTNTKYIYDEENKTYLRYMSDEAHVDAITGNQYTAKNVIVYKVRNYEIDDYGRQNLENIGSGEGYYITEGYAVPITWTKDSRESKTIYKYADGTEIKVNDGNTWIQIQPEGQLLDIIEYPEEVSIEE